jgi:hypothetical protein
MELLKDKRYKPLRQAGAIFLDHLKPTLFQGLGNADEYHKKKLKKCFHFFSVLL